MEDRFLNLPCAIKGYNRSFRRYDQITLKKNAYVKAYKLEKQNFHPKLIYFLKNG